MTRVPAVGVLGGLLTVSLAMAPAAAAPVKPDAEGFVTATVIKGTWYVSLGAAAEGVEPVTMLRIFQAAAR